MLIPQKTVPALAVPTLDGCRFDLQSRGEYAGALESNLGPLAAL